jgi:hypothetical protein
MHVYDVQDGEDANGKRNGSSSSGYYDSECDAEPISDTVTEPDSGG